MLITLGAAVYCLQSYFPARSCLPSAGATPLSALPAPSALLNGNLFISGRCWKHLPGGPAFPSPFCPTNLSLFGAHPFPPIATLQKNLHWTFHMEREVMLFHVLLVMMFHLDSCPLTLRGREGKDRGILHVCKNYKTFQAAYNFSFLNFSVFPLSLLEGKD